MVQAEG